MIGIDDSVLSSLERQYESGLTSGALIDICGAHGIQLSEATLRKYVQLGLMPRSTRVGRKGKHQGSLGVYPVRAIRQLLRIKEMMAESYTIEEIRRDFLFVRTEIEQLEHTLGCVFKAFARVLEQRGKEGSRRVGREVNEVKGQGRQLVARLEALESLLVRRASMKDSEMAPAALRAKAS